MDKGNVVVGAVFLAGAGLLLYAMAAADPELVGLVSATPPRTDDRVLRVVFDDAGNLSPGTPVKASGIKIGTVRSLDFLPATGKVEVEMAISEKDLVLYPGHRFTVKPESALGGLYVDVEIGDPTADPVGEDLEEGTRELDALESIGAQVEEYRPEIREVIETLRRVTDDIVNGRGTMGSLVADRGVHEDIERFVGEARRAIDMIRDGEGSVGRLMRDPEVYDEIAAAVSEVREITARMQAGEGPIGALVADDEAYRNLLRTLSDLDEALGSVREGVARVERGEGTFGSLFRDRSLYDEWNGQAARIAETAAGLARGEGTLGRLLTDDDLYDGLLATVGNLRDTTGEINRGEGTIGDLVKNERVYFRLRDSIRSITSSVEEGRAGSPVNDFASILLNSF